MKLFLISPQDEYKERVKSLLKQKFDDDYIELSNRSSFICILAAPSDLTSSAVSKMLNMTSTRVEPEDVNSGVIVEIGDYFGYDSKELWQKMEVWLNE